MRYRIVHTIEYLHSRPVFHEPHVFHLHPREDGVQKLQEFKLTIDPKPAALTTNADVCGNKADSAWFEGSFPRLFLKAESVVETLRTNPFDYLMAPSGQSVPVKYDSQHAPILKPFIVGKRSATTIRKFSKAIASETRNQTADFLNALTKRLFESYEKIAREEGLPWAPSRTLASKKASCRDLSVLFMECCRVQGIASRFVSGYYEADPDKSQKDLHAWVEVYVAGGGWRAFDPTNGLAVSDRHVALAAARTAKEASPIIGTYRGTGATSTIQYSVTMNRV
jgi:transglutaminase-like putative cysteine protease